MRLKTLVGKEVLNEKASIIGKISDMEIDSTEGNIKSIIVKPAKKDKNNIISSFIKDKNEMIVPYDMIKKIGDKIVLKKPITDARSIYEELENI